MITVMQDEFRSAVLGLVDEYLAEYGVSEVVTYNSCLIRAHLTYCRVGFYLDWHDVGITLQPYQGENDASPGELGLLWLIDEDRRRDVRRAEQVRGSSDIRSALRSLILLLIECCDVMLRGDFSRWRDIETHVAMQKPPMSSVHRRSTRPRY